MDQLHTTINQCESLLTHVAGARSLERDNESLKGANDKLLKANLGLTAELNKERARLTKHMELEQTTVGRLEHSEHARREDLKLLREQREGAEAVASRVVTLTEELRQERSRTQAPGPPAVQPMDQGESTDTPAPEVRRIQLLQLPPMPPDPLIGMAQGRIQELEAALAQKTTTCDNAIRSAKLHLNHHKDAMDKLKKVYSSESDAVRENARLRAKLAATKSRLVAKSDELRDWTQLPKSPEPDDSP